MEIATLDSRDHPCFHRILRVLSEWPCGQYLPLVARRRAPRQNGERESVRLPNPFVTQLEKTWSRYTACCLANFDVGPTLRSQRLTSRTFFFFSFFFFFAIVILFSICRNLRARAGASKLVNFERERVRWRIRSWKRAEPDAGRIVPFRTEGRRTENITRVRAEVVEFLRLVYFFLEITAGRISAFD